MSSETILIIEKDADERRMLHDMLEINGYTLLRSGSGIEGFDLASTARPDLILLDFSLPDISGVEMTRKLKRDQRTRGIPIVALTAAADEEDDRRVLNSGCDAFLVRPVDRIELRRFVEVFAAGHPEPKAPVRKPAAVTRRSDHVPVHLPPPTTKWTSRRKAALILAVRFGIITLDAACGRYRLSPEEFQSWEAAFDANGLAGLRATRR